MNNDPRNNTSDNIWDQNQDQFEDYDDWPPPDEFRGVKLAMIGLVLGAVVIAGGWWAWRTLVPADYRDQAREYVAEGNYPSAVIELKSVIQENPDDAEMRWLLGISYLQLDLPALARDQLQAAFELGYFEQPLLLALTRANLLDGEYEAALALVREWSDDGSVEWEVLHGRALLSLGRQERAVDAFVKVLRQDASNMVAKRALAYTGIGPELSAWVDSDIDKALSTGLDQPETWLLRGELALSQGNYEQARAAFEKAGELGPNNAYARSGLVRVLLGSNQLEAAREPVRVLTQRFPTDPGGAYVRALYAKEHGEYELALDALEIVISHDPYHAMSLLLLGEVQQAMGKHEQAVLNLSRFHRLVPDSIVGRKRLVRALLDSGQPERALELLEPVKDSVYKDPEIATLLVTASAQLDNQSKAQVKQPLSGELDSE